jgi:2-succinyl-5-enolpyruvyl-6-hydroxy-3-cyclohexene-1-carboxylate synthase
MSPDIIDELLKAGCELFAIAPGSRSTPLVLAAASAGVKTVVCHDERSLGFFALGHAKATGKPAAIIVTSGTAVANLFPAVVEAFMSQTPLIILSADRPAELRGSGANQTIDQVRMFGNYARYFLDLTPCARVRELVCQAASRALGPIPGPVQINCQFTEPLV